MCPAKVSDGAERGWIIPIGGGEKKVKSSSIHRKFVELCGGSEARIVVIPTASKLPDTGDRYKALFHAMKVGDVEVVSLESRQDCEDPERLAILERATGVFLTGGNQLRLATVLGGTSIAKLIRIKNAHGVHVAGTSAGAAFISEHMIAFGKGGPTPKSGMATMSPGLGLINRVIVDQHFGERDRLGRLLSALAYNPFATGIGVDEDTAAFIGPDDTIQIVGSGAITVIDPSDIEYSSMAEAKEGKPVSLIGVKLHILLAGDRYHLSTHKAEPASE